MEEPREEGRKGSVSEGGKEGGKVEDERRKAGAKERTRGNEKFKRDGRWGGRLRGGREGGTQYDRKRRQKAESSKKFRNEGQESDRKTKCVGSSRHARQQERR